MNDTATARSTNLLPFIVGGAFVALFVWAGFWQAGKAGIKRDEIEAFAAQPTFRSFTSGNAVRKTEGLRVRGTWLGDRQIILDSIIVDSRVGHYVLTPFETAPDEPLLIVNRGFLPASDGGIAAADIEIGDTPREVLGRVGRLPRTGYRMGQAIPEVSTWPVHAVYPVYEDLEITLGREVQPFVLLLDAEGRDLLEGAGVDLLELADDFAAAERPAGHDHLHALLEPRRVLRQEVRLHLQMGQVPELENGGAGRQHLPRARHSRTQLF